MKFELPNELKFITNARLPQKTSTESMVGKTCVITGTTSGVGYSISRRLASAGAKIVMIVRNEEKAKKLSDELSVLSKATADYYIADFSNLRQVKVAAESILQNYPKVDVLINNAGVHMTKRVLTEEGHEMAFCVNHLSSFLITDLFLERMKECAPSRIIQISSEGHRFNGLRLDDITWEKRRYRGLKGYGASKVAQMLCVWEFNDMLKDSGVTINAVHPGEVKSNIGTNNGKIYNLYSKYIIQPMLKDTAVSGEAIFYHASSPEMEKVSGKFFNLTNEEIPASHALDRDMGKKVFELSKRLTDI